MHCLISPQSVLLCKCYVAAILSLATSSTTGGFNIPLPPNLDEASASLPHHPFREVIYWSLPMLELKLPLPPFLNLAHGQSVHPNTVDEEKGPHLQDRKVIHFETVAAVV
jgi:hypothetical protein